MADRKWWIGILEVMGHAAIPLLLYVHYTNHVDSFVWQLVGMAAIAWFISAVFFWQFMFIEPISRAYDFIGTAMMSKNITRLEKDAAINRFAFDIVKASFVGMGIAYMIIFYFLYPYVVRLQEWMEGFLLIQNYIY